MMDFLEGDAISWHEDAIVVPFVYQGDSGNSIVHFENVGGTESSESKSGHERSRTGAKRCHTPFAASTTPGLVTVKHIDDTGKTLDVSPIDVDHSRIKTRRYASYDHASGSSQNDTTANRSTHSELHVTMKESSTMNAQCTTNSSIANSSDQIECNDVIEINSDADNDDDDDDDVTILGQSTSLSSSLGTKKCPDSSEATGKRRTPAGLTMYYYSCSICPFKHKHLSRMYTHRQEHRQLIHKNITDVSTIPRTGADTCGETTVACNHCAVYPEETFEEHYMTRHVRQVVPCKVINVGSIDNLVRKAAPGVTYYMRCSICAEQVKLEKVLSWQQSDAHAVQHTLKLVEADVMAQAQKQQQRQKLAICEACGSQHETAFDVRKHFRLNHLLFFARATQQQMNTFYDITFCGKCGILLEQSNRSAHPLQHRYTNQFKCFECDKVFRKYYDLKAHSLNGCHADAQRSRDVPRRLAVSTVVDVDTTDIDESLQLNRFGCEACDLCFGSRADFMEHFRAAHIKTLWLERHLCEYCGIGFFSRSVFNAHECELTLQNALVRPVFAQSSPEPRGKTSTYAENLGSVPSWGPTSWL